MAPIVIALTAYAGAEQANCRTFVLQAPICRAVTIGYGTQVALCSCSNELDSSVSHDVIVIVPSQHNGRSIGQAPTPLCVPIRIAYGDSYPHSCAGCARCEHRLLSKVCHFNFEQVLYHQQRVESRLLSHDTARVWPSIPKRSVTVTIS